MCSTSSNIGDMEEKGNTVDKQKTPIYLDYNATTPLAASVIKLIAVALLEGWGNPSSNNKYGILAKTRIETARQHVAAMIGATSKEIIFTSGGTEANNMVIKGIPMYFSTWRTVMQDGRVISNMLRPHIVTSNVEHDATIKPLRYLLQIGEIVFTEVPVGPDGCLSADSVILSLRPNTCLITIMHANNETGVVMPIDEIGRKLVNVNRERKRANLPRILFHTDAAQTIGKLPISVDALQVDYMSIVGHKIYGPRIGALYRRDNDLTKCYAAPLFPLIHGGGQESGWRSGTANTPMIVGLGEAARLIKVYLGDYMSRMLELREYLEEKLRLEFGCNIGINCATSPRLPNTSSVSFHGDLFQGHAILTHCQRLMASTASACHDQSTSSKILLNSGVKHEEAINSIRLSIGRDTTKLEIDLAVADISNAMTSLVPKPTAS